MKSINDISTSNFATIGRKYARDLYLYVYMYGSMPTAPMPFITIRHAAIQIINETN